MTRLSYFLLLLLLSGSFLAIARANAFPSSSFTEKNGEWYDSWGYDRNVYDGEYGYLPNIAYETLGANKELAYSIGESFKNQYASETQRADAILSYVQTWTVYGYDSDNVFKDGVAQDEWAWNADEMAHAFNEDTGVQATGDCEDMAFLCATIYTGAGIDAAVVDAPEHVACLIWLPQYSNANYYWDLPSDDRGQGWIWVEATGQGNPVGWTPPDFGDGNWNAYPVGSQINPGTTSPPSNGVTPPVTQSSGIPTELIFVGVIIVAVVAALLFFGSRKHTRPTQDYPPPPPPPPQ